MLDCTIFQDTLKSTFAIDLRRGPKSASISFILVIGELFLCLSIRLIFNVYVKHRTLSTRALVNNGSITLKLTVKYLYIVRNHVCQSHKSFHLPTVSHSSFSSTFNLLGILEPIERLVVLP